MSLRFYGALTRRTTVLVATLSAAAAAQQGAVKPDSARTLQRVSVTASMSGRGSARGTFAVDSSTIRSVAPGTSALKVIERLPGVNVQGADGFGMYEWANRITMRGFQTQQIGQTMDGIPLGDMSYGNFNGLGVGRAVDATNLAATAVTEGTGALGTASGNNLGGVVQYTTADPTPHRQFMLQQMGGQYSARRTTLRFDTGLHTVGSDAGINAFLSLARFDTDKWKSGGERFSTFPGEQRLLFGQSGFIGGAGQQWQDQINAKANLFVGPHKFTAYYNFAHRKESDYMDLSLSIFNKTVSAPGFTFGPDFDYLSSWTQSKQLAELSTSTYNPLTDASYFYSAQGAREDHLAYVKADLALSSSVHAQIQPYMHMDRGGGDWHAPSYGAAYSPDPIMFRQSQYHDNRVGVVGKLTASFSAGSIANHAEFGGWYESNTTRIRRPRWRLTDYQAGPDVNYTNVLRLDFDRTGDLGTTMVYAQNTSVFANERLAVTYGAKYLHVSADFTNNGNTPTDGVTSAVFGDPTRPALSAPTDGGVLPQVGVVFRLNDRDELFGNYSENVNQFPYSPSGGVYNAAPSTFDFFRNTAKPEHATTIEFGARTRRGRIEAGVTAYTIDYRNRLLGIALCPPTVTCATGFGNVGSVSSDGVEGVFAVDLGRQFKLTTSGSYNASTFGDDYLANQNDPASVVRIKGKDVQDAPRLLGNATLSFAAQRLSASASGRFVDKRYFTYTNDLVDGTNVVTGGGKVPSYVVGDLSARYRIGSFGALHALELQLNVYNVLDKRYIGAMGTNGYTPSSDFQTLLTGAPRQVFLTLNTVF